MASIMDLFQSKKKELYGNNGIVYIESRGLVNIPRTVALAASSPNAAADMIGNVATGVIKASAKRPSDTIFKNDQWYSKPISLTAPTPSSLKDSIKEGLPYFVKTEPNPGAGLYGNIKTIIGGGSNLQSLGIKALNKYGSKSGIESLENLRDRLKNPEPPDTYGPILSHEGNDKRKPKTENKTYSEYYMKYDTIEKAKERQGGKLMKRKNPVLKNGGSHWDQINYNILNNLGKGMSISDDDLSDFKTTTNETINMPYVLFQLYGKTNSNILLPGTVSGISEDYTPEISTFKYVGSPFNLYRYGGVERSLKFDLKMYYVDEATKISMKRNLDKLRMLVFPDENITAIQYPTPKEGNKFNSPLTFNPNLVYLTINGLYYKMLGIVDTLSISIDDTTSWSGMNMMGGDDSNGIKLHPNIINVSLGMKVIEHPNVEFTEVYSDENLTATKPVSIPKFAYGQSTFYQNNQYENYFTGYDNTK